MVTTQVLKQFTKGEVKEVLDKVGNIVQSTSKKKKKAKDLLEKEPIKEKKVGVFKTEPVKKPEATVIEAQDFLKDYKGKIKPQELADFNINKITSKEDVIKLIDIISKRYAKDITAQKRGVQTNKATQEFADLLNKDKRKLTTALLSLKPGQTLNAEWILAARELLVAGMSKLDDLAKKAEVGGPDALLEFKQQMALMSELQKIYKGVQTETGRALQQFQIPTRDKRFTSIDLDDLNAETLLVELGGEEQIRNVAKLYLRTGDNTVAKLKFTQETGTLTKISDSVAEVFLNAILSNPLTHVRNTAGNWITQAIVQQERKIAAKFFSKGGKDSVAAYEDIAKAYGKSQAISEMWTGILKGDMPKNFIAGSKVELRPAKFTAENFELGNNGFAKMFDILGKGATLGRIPMRMLTVADAWFKNGEYRSEIYALAFREAMGKYNNRVLRKENIAAYIADIVSNPTKDMQKSAFEAAQYITFQTPIGKRGDFLDAAKAAQYVKNKAGPMSWFTNYYFPFVQTPTNILGFSLERTPILQFALKRFRDDLKAGGARAEIAKARMALGSAFFIPMATQGYFGFPAEFKGSNVELTTYGNVWTGAKRETEKMLGWQQKSLHIPVGDGKYHQYNLSGYDPVAMFAAMAADTGKLVAMVGDNHDQWEDILQHSAALTYILGENLTNSTFMAGAGKLNRDIRNLSTQGKAGVDKTVKSFATSFIPGIVKGPFKWLVQDDYQKIAIEWNEYLKRTTLDHGLESDYDYRGREYNKFAFKTSYEMDYIDDEIKRVNPSIKPAKKYITVPVDGTPQSVNVPLNSEEQRWIKENTGIYFNQELEDLFQSDLYKNARSINMQQALIQERYSKASSHAKDGKNFLSDARPYKASLIERANEIYKAKEVTKQRGVPFNQ